jgi:hypothetical protein
MGLEIINKSLVSHPGSVQSFNFSFPFRIEDNNGCAEEMLLLLQR